MCLGELLQRHEDGLAAVTTLAQETALEHAVTRGAVDEVRKIADELRVYEPMLRDLKAAGLDQISARIKDELEALNGADGDILAMVIKGIISEELGITQDTFEALVKAVDAKQTEAVGKVALDVKGLVKVVEQMRSDLTTVQATVKTHGADIKGHGVLLGDHQNRLDGHDKDIAELKKGATIGERFSMLTFFGTLLVLTAVLFALAKVITGSDKGYNDGRTFAVVFLISICIAGITACIGGGEKSNKDSVKLKDRVQGFKQPGASSETTKANTTTPPPAPTPAQTTASTTPSPAMAAAAPGN